MERFDVVVIGAGPGGYPAAIRAAQLGASVAIVERERFGGTCLNYGCIPTKTLIASAETFAHVRDAEAFGVSVSGATFDYAAMVRRKDKVVDQLRGGVKQLLTANGVKSFAGSAAFKDRETIVIDGGLTIGAKKTIIATGSTSATPGFIPAHERIVESRAFLALDRLPKSMIVLGGGFIGCEIASMAAMLGVKVTIVELLADILMLLDADLRSEVRAHMEKALGIRVLTGKPLADIAADANGVSGRCGDETLRADLLLNAVGRRPVTDGLNLAAAGLEANARGFIDDRRLLPDQGGDDLRHRRRHRQDPARPLRHRAGDRRGGERRRQEAAPARNARPQRDLHRARSRDRRPERIRGGRPEARGQDRQVPLLRPRQGPRRRRDDRFRQMDRRRGIRAAARRRGGRAARHRADRGRHDGDPRRVHRARARRNDPRPSDLLGGLDGGRPRAAGRKHPCSAAPALADGKRMAP